MSEQWNSDPFGVMSTGRPRWRAALRALRYGVEMPDSLKDHAVTQVEAAVTLLRRVLSEYVAGNRIVDGYWYSPDETGAPHYRNQEATADELALVESLRTEVGL